ncbi:unnamed protein product [Adineta ricciae]|uniref:Folate receptor-like domain-containing protein n=1 Tax=Adineta ricciae TaxID=249248 RepID=A0A815ZKI7_ADIRI|nr:unnamed protein product [Adineta ricciae]
MYSFHSNKRSILVVLILVCLIEYSLSTNTNDKAQITKDNNENQAKSSDASTRQSTNDDSNQVSLSESNPPVQSDKPAKSRIEKENKDYEGNLNIKIENILQEIDIKLQQSDLSNTNEKEISSDADESEDEEDVQLPLTSEMQQANAIYHQAVNLINGTINRQYRTAYKLFKQAADLGHIGAKEELAFAHLMGVHLPMDFKRAQTYFEEGIALGSPQSHYGIYFMNSVGLIPDASVSKALVHLTFAAADGYHPAQMALAYRYWRSINIAHSCELALIFYQQVATHVASKITSASGQLVQRIRLYDEEENPAQSNIMSDNDLLQYYQLLADRGDPQAQYGLGQLYYLRDTAFDKALYYFRLAAENGNVNALAYLGKLYSEKNDYIKQNNQTAVQFFQRAVAKGNAIGQAGLGLAYYYGAGVEQNFEKAFKLFQLGAAQSNAEAQLMLGVLYYNGEGTQRDFKTAIKWFQAASQSGHVLAYYNLAQMHATGTGVLRSCPTATELFKNVAERGRWSHMFTEALNLFRQGHVEQAFMIYLYLAELGYEVAQSNVAYIIDQMSLDISNIYRTKEERYKKALIYWNRAAVQGFHYARVKLGDYYYYGHGTEQNYELAASHYKSASDHSHSAQAMFNLAYMHEKGLGLKRDLHLAKRFYDMAVETNIEAYLPVTIVLIKLQIESFFERLFSNSKSSSSTSPPPSKSPEEKQTTSVDIDTLWDLYLMAALLGLIGALYTILWTHNSSLYTVSSQSAPYCSFFSNRAPSPQPALTNCTWFQENSCCRENEVRHIFSQVRPLIGSSAECSQFLNILMCYVCSPLQYHFYRSERLHVCSSYCDRMYKACATALMKGIPVGELYANGREFCLSRRFEISDISNSSSCFSDDYGSVTTKQIKNSNSNLSSTNIERPSMINMFLVICLAAMLSFILC